MPRHVGGGIRPIDRSEVRQGHVARAEAVKHPQVAEGVLDHVTAFDADHRRDPPVPMNADNVVGHPRELEVSVALHILVDDVELPERILERRARVSRFGRREDRPKLPADQSFPQPRYVGR